MPDMSVLGRFINTGAADVADSAWESAKKLLGGASEQDQTPAALDESVAMRERISKELAMNDEQLEQAVHLYSEMVNPGYFQRVAASTAEGMMQSAYAGNRVVGAAMAKSLGANDEMIQKKISIQSQLLNLATAKSDYLRRKLELELMPQQREAQIENIAGLREQREATAEMRRSQAVWNEARAKREDARVKFEEKMTASDIAYQDEQAKTEVAKQKMYEASAVEKNAKAANIPEMAKIKAESAKAKDEYVEQLTRQSKALTANLLQKSKHVADTAPKLLKGMSEEKRKELSAFAKRYVSDNAKLVKDITALTEKISEAKEARSSIALDKKMSEDMKKAQLAVYDTAITEMEGHLDRLGKVSRNQDGLYAQYIAALSEDVKQPDEEDPPPPVVQPPPPPGKKKYDPMGL